MRRRRGEGEEQDEEGQGEEEQEAQDSRQGAALLFAPAPHQLRLPLHKTEAQRQRTGRWDFTAELLRLLFACSELLGGTTDTT